VVVKGPKVAAVIKAEAIPAGAITKTRVADMVAEAMAKTKTKAEGGTRRTKAGAMDKARPITDPTATAKKGSPSNERD
tara:strand:- start:1754 stop:1987 length:234 start_codon:yes stop_codon:yes gene_type:complete